MRGALGHSVRRWARDCLGCIGKGRRLSFGGSLATAEREGFGWKLLRAYPAWLPDDWRLVVLVDRDNDDCRALKKGLEDAAVESGLLSRTRSGGACWQIVNRVVIEELEAWYFGDWQAVRSAYPKIPETIPRRKGYRYPDEIRGGTWEAFERVMQAHGYFRSGLRKI